MRWGMAGIGGFEGGSENRREIDFIGSTASMHEKMENVSPFFGSRNRPWRSPGLESDFVVYSVEPRRLPCSIRQVTTSDHLKTDFSDASARFGNDSSSVHF